MGINIKDKKRLNKTAKVSFPLHALILDNKVEAASEFCRTIKSENIHIIDGFNDNGDTPLICAIKKSNEDIVDILLQSGANPDQQNIDGETPLISATKFFNSNIITMLIEEGADVNQPNSLDESPLKIATNLENQECITLLTEFGASFAKKAAAHTIAPSNSEDFNYQEEMLSLVEITIKSKKTKELQQKFKKNIVILTNKYLGKNIVTSKDFLNSHIIFEQISDINKNSFVKKDSLNIVRKIISSINSSTKHTFLASDDTQSLYLLSKAETSTEESITKLKLFTTSQPEITYKSHAELEKENNHEASTEELYKKTHESQEMFEITKEKMLCRTSRHDMVLTKIVTLRPHHPRVPKDAASLLKLSKKRILEEADLLKINKDSVKKEISKIEEIINTAKKEKRHFTNNEGHKIDHLVRPGKAERLHIVHFPSENFKNGNKETLIEALETGATIHYFEYPECAETANDLVFAGISAVNKLLDEDIHPDKIILQGVGEEAIVANETALQFEKRGIYLTRISIDYPEIPSSSSHREVSLTFPAKPAKECDPEIKTFLLRFNKILKNQTKPEGSYFLKNRNPITISQLLNLYITKTQQFYNTHAKDRNTSLPKERVENIIGLPDIDER